MNKRYFYYILLVLILLSGIFVFLEPPSTKETQTDSKQTKDQQSVQPKTLTLLPVEIPLKVPAGYSIGTFATDIPQARDLELTEQGTLLISSPSTGNVYALPDNNSDGQADDKKVIITGRLRPHGLAFHKGKLYLAEETRVSRYEWDESTLTATFEKVLFTLPRGGNHPYRTIVFDKKDNLYISVGSTCNVCIESHPYPGNIIISDGEGKTPQVFARGLRNAPFMITNPITGDLWATGMGRDYLGDNLPPDEINVIEKGKDYGWPVCYGNQIHDTDFDKKTYIRNPCLDTIRPRYNLSAHVAPLGLVFISSKLFAVNDQNDLLVALHGSWNRTMPIGYKVIKIEANSTTLKNESDFVTGFLQKGTAVGRPVDVIFNNEGHLFISDDKAGAVYIVAKS